jgi:putative ABC transport system substrate-binding protein
MFSLTVFLVGGAVLGGTVLGEPRRGPVLIGALTHSWGPTPAVVGLRDGLRDLGHRESEHFVIGVRFTQGDVGALPAAARELVQHGAEILFAAGGNEAKAAQMATNRIPVIFVVGSDPVTLGLVQSLNRPGGNLTGLASLDIELAPKRLELFREMVPGLRRVLLPYDATDAYTLSQLDLYREAARALGLVLVEKPARTQEEARRIITGARKGEVDGILSPRLISLNIPGFMLEAATVMPTMFHGAFYVERGGLASYAASDYELGRQAARFVDKIIKGANAGDLPVDRATKFSLTVNVKTARALGLTIPPSLLLRADEVIE